MRFRLLEMSIVITVLASASSVASADASINLLTNGSFETGDFTGWTVLNASPPPNNAVVVTNADLIDPEDGQYEAAFVGIAGAQIAQTVKDVAGREARGQRLVRGYRSGRPVGSHYRRDPARVPILGTGAYREFSFAFVATGSDTLQIFSLAQDDDESVNLVDNLSIVPVVGISPGVPEVSTWMMMLLGFCGVAAAGALSSGSRRGLTA
jgi:hypothetical protein